MIRISGVRPHSLVNGPGVRYVVFTQGCPHHCDGCQNPGTWNPEGGSSVSIDSISNDIYHQHIRGLIDGVTFSGGEPFLQQEACARLIMNIPNDLSIWIYTGYKYEDICDTELAKMADFIVDGRFEEDKLVEGGLYGSSNQRIIDVKKGLIYSHGERFVY